MDILLKSIAHTFFQYGITKTGDIEKTKEST